MTNHDALNLIIWIIFGYGLMSILQDIYEVLSEARERYRLWRAELRIKSALTEFMVKADTLKRAAND